MESLVDVETVGQTSSDVVDCPRFSEDFFLNYCAGEFVQTMPAQGEPQMKLSCFGGCAMRTILEGKTR